MGGDGQLFAGKVELITEDNQRWSTRLVYAKVNPKINQLIKHSLIQIHLKVYSWAGAGMFISQFV
jgi:hypothetical protein